MEANTKKRLKKIGGEKILFDVPMSQYTTFRVGGNAEAIYRAGNLEELKEMMAFITDTGISYLVLGVGSNLLVRDGGLDGVAIILDGYFASIEDNNMEEPCILAGAGLLLNKLVNFCTDKGLSGVEFLAGIPGTLGGGVVMNAGTGTQEIKDVIREVTVLTKGGILERRDNQNLKFRYRGLDLDIGEIILCAVLNLKRDKPASIRKRVKYRVKRRKERFPLDMPSAGSIFKNPEGNHAGRLIDAVGLKGKTIGGAIISIKHANFIVNKGKASASDILALMDLAVVRVREMFNIQLSPEIKIVGKG
jgi:UDP-N-acetylmuramate dehydrogenase